MNPLLLVTALRRVILMKSQPDSNPIAKGQVVDAIPLIENPCLWAWRPIATKSKTTRESMR